jgi:TatD DNase family protein
MKNNIIDTHAHIYFPDFYLDLDSVITRALKIGVSKIYLPSLNSNSYDKINNLVNIYPKLLVPMLGLHPLYVDDNFVIELQSIYNQLKIHQYTIIGEIGLDFILKDKFYEQQIQAFSYQLCLSQEMSLPIVIHCRNSFNHILHIFKKMNIFYKKGIFHCFSGSLYQAQQIIDFGMKIGIGGLLTFTNCNLSSILKNISIKDIVLETDSPYLCPHPFRGKRNEPCYLHYIIETLSNIYSISYEDVCNITTNNVKSIFS